MRLDRHARIGLLVLLVLVTAAPAMAQPVSVTSAEPSSGEQDTPSLNVHVKGKGFANGAKVTFYIDHEEVTGGITVNSETFVSSTEVVANVTIAAGASLALFDIKVTNSNGRTGRGSDLFQVVEKGAKAACANEALDETKFAFVQTLNSLTVTGAPAYGPNLGVSVSLAPATLSLPDSSVRTVLAAAVGTPNGTGRVEFFVLDSSTGALLEGPLCDAGCDPQGHVSAVIPGQPAGSRHITKGDVNADGLPDFAVADQVNGSASVFVARFTLEGQLRWNAILLPKPSNVANYGYDVAIGDLDGEAGDEIAVARLASGNGKNFTPPAVYIYKATSTSASLHQTFVPTVTPALKADDAYAFDLAIGDVTNDGRPDLVVGVPAREVLGVTDAGAVFVHTGTDLPPAGPPYTLAATPLVLSAATKVSRESLGQRVAIGNADSSGGPDVVALTHANINPHGEVFHGPAVNGQLSDPAFGLLPRAGLTNGWAQNQAEIGDLNGDGLKDVVISVPSAASTGCTNQGMVYVYLGDTSPAIPGPWRALTIQGEQDGDVSTFGFGLGIADGYPFIVVGNNQFSLDGEASPAGQVYVYRVLP